MSGKSNLLLVAFFVLLVITLAETAYFFFFYKTPQPSKIIVPAKKISASGLNTNTLGAYTAKAKKGLLLRSSATSLYAGELISLVNGADKSLTVKAQSGETLIFNFPQEQIKKIKVFRLSSNKRMPATWSALKTGNQIKIFETIDLNRRPKLAFVRAEIVIVK